MLGSGPSLSLLLPPFLPKTSPPPPHSTQLTPLSQGERMTCASPLTNLFHDLPAPEAARWAARLSFQPARGWDGVIRHTAWREIPSVYLVCEGDRVVPPALQRMFAAAAGSEVVSCGAGHMPMLSVPGTVVGCVRRGAGAVEGL